jgi:hypothetical protein
MAPDAQPKRRATQEAMMVFVEAMMIAGLCIIAGAAGFLLVNGLKARRGAGGQDLLADEQRGARLDLYMCFVWSGMLLVQASNILLHRDPGGTYHLSSLTLAATAGQILACGVFAGRLLLRRELRWIKEKRDEQSRASRA